MPILNPSAGAVPPPSHPYPGWLGLLRQWGDAYRQQPWAVQPGYQPAPFQYPVIPEAEQAQQQGGLLQRVADIYNFPKKGLMGTLATEGAGGRGLGARGGGLLGSQWRDPRFIQQYEVQQGLPPGSIKPPSAEVRQMPTQLDAAFKKAQAEHQAEIAKRIQARDPNRAKFEAALQEHRNTPIPTREAAMASYAAKMAALRASEGPTPAQMARPVRSTPEIQAKLAEARARRAASEGMRLVTDAKAWMSAGKGRLPFDSKVIADRFNRMSSEQQEIFNRTMFPQDYR